MHRRLPLVSTVLLLAACAPPAREGDFNSPDPAAKIYAIHQAGDAQDRSKVPSIIEQLDNDDPAVRMMAIEALERITNKDLDYNPYAPRPQREKAIEAIAAAARRGEL